MTVLPLVGRILAVYFLLFFFFSYIFEYFLCRCVQLVIVGWFFLNSGDELCQIHYWKHDVRQGHQPNINKNQISNLS